MWIFGGHHCTSKLRFKCAPVLRTSVDIREGKKTKLSAINITYSTRYLDDSWLPDCQFTTRPSQWQILGHEIPQALQGAPTGSSLHNSIRPRRINPGSRVRSTSIIRRDSRSTSEDISKPEPAPIAAAVVRYANSIMSIGTKVLKLNSSGRIDLPWKVTDEVQALKLAHSDRT